MLTAALGRCGMHVCKPHLVYSDVAVYSNALLYVSMFSLPTDLRWFLPCKQEEHSPKPQRGYGRPEPWGEGMQASLLTTLTKKGQKFEWTPACQKSFELLKEALCCEPVLKYANVSKPYTLYTDGSKFGWAGVLTQKHTADVNGKQITTDHPVAFVSGLFRGSQLNWAALTKEAFAIYMSVKKLSFYLTDAQILLRSDHKPLEKFLLKNTLNSKMNNWAMELEAFNIQFDYIKGQDNILADTLSRLVDINPDMPLTPEGQGYEFGYAIFEEFPKVKTKTYEVNEVIVGTDKKIKSDPDL